MLLAHRRPCNVHAMAARIVQLSQLNKVFHLVAASPANDGCREAVRQLANDPAHLRAADV